MVIVPKADVGATAVANLYRLVLGNTKSSRAPYARTGLTGLGIPYAV